MLKMPENKTRKKLRITLCVLYLVEIVLCALPYFQYIDEKNVLHSYSVFDIMSVWGLSGSNDAVFKYSLFMPIFFIIPIAGFFFCALDKERNMKNIVSIICCLLGVLSILTMVSYTISLASVIALLLYILICFLTTLSIFARFTDKDATKAPVKQKNTDPNREVWFFKLKIENERLKISVGNTACLMQSIVFPTFFICWLNRVLALVCNVCKFKTVLTNKIFHQGWRPMNAPTTKIRQSFTTAVFVFISNLFVIFSFL